MKLLIKTAFKVLGVTVLLISISSCNSKVKTEQLSQMQFAKDSLEGLINERDSLLNEVMLAFNQIEDDLAFVKETRGVISVTTDNPELEKNRKDEIVKDVQELAIMLKESKQKLTSLNKKLKSSGVKIASLESRINELSTNLNDRNSELLTLKDELEQKNYEVGILNEQVVELEAVKSHQEEVIVEQETQITKHNIAYYVVGTKKELKEKGLVTQEGGFLGIGKTKNLNSNVTKEYFSEIDIRNVNTIPVNSKEVNLISEHPDGSYKFVSEGEVIASLEIDNPEEFYKFSKYIVMEVE